MPGYSCKYPLKWSPASQPIMRAFLFLPSITPPPNPITPSIPSVFGEEMYITSGRLLVGCVETEVHPPLPPLPANKNLHFLQWALACNTAILAWQLSVFLSSICHFFCLVFLTNFALAHTHKADSFGLETTDHSSVSTFMREHSQMPFQLVINHRRQRTI